MNAPKGIAAGYAALIEQLGVRAIPHYRTSSIVQQGGRRTTMADGIECHAYPRSYRPNDTISAQLEFALKYDGVNLEILRAVFEQTGPTPVLELLERYPTGKHARRLAFLYEWLTEDTLPVPDVRSGNYVDLLDARRYYTAKTAKSRRFRINDNLLGDRRFCPMVRRSESLSQYEAKQLDAQSRQIVAKYNANTIARATRYLYTKETLTSFAIEHERPSKNRAERFMQVLMRAGGARLDKATLVGLQNITVDPRFADTDYRTSQNYVGESLGLHRQRVHYVSPRPSDVPSMMAGLLNALLRMLDSGVQPVVAAAASSFGFVFVHPFEDGNGRLHRFMIHHILAQTGFTPSGLIFPVSSCMLERSQAYDACLEAFSRPLLRILDFDVDDEGVMSVRGNTDFHYRYFDATPMAEYLFSCVEETLFGDFTAELEFIVHYDHAKRSLQDIVDLPDRKIDLFIRLCTESGFQLSKAKRRSHFDHLTDNEITAMEAAVRIAWGSDPQPKQRGP